MQTGWVAKDGSFYPCETYEHVSVAENLIKKLKLPRMENHDRYLGVDAPDDVLLHHGWVRITRSLLFSKEQNIYWEKRLTSDQISFLMPYFEENDEVISETSKMRWEYELDCN